MQEGLRIVTVAIWKTIPSIFVAIIPYIFYLLICSLIGISLFVDKGWQCSDTSILEKNKCKGNYIDRFDKNVTRHWIPYSVTFDNFFDGLLSTFVISHQEAWPDIMYRYINLSADDTVRPEKIHLNYSIFFVFAILIGNWLFLSVITAVTFNSLKRNQDILSGMQYLTNGQRKILDYLKILVTNQPKLNASFSERTKNPRIRALVQSSFFNRIMLTVICINIAFMMMMSYNLNETLSTILYVSEFIFTFIYIIELVLLFKAYGIKDFFKDFWNILSFIIVFTSVLSLLFVTLIPSSFLVLIRLIRIIRLFQYSKGIKALGMAVMSNFTQLINVLILMFLTCCIYAVIGYTYFGDINIEHTNYLNENVNFSSFSKSLTTVFIFSTGEGWPFGMADCMGKTITNCDPLKENCGTPYAVIFFITLHIVLNWILLNSFSAITVDTFITVLEEHDEIVRLEKVWDEFNKQWIEYDRNKSGEVIFTDLINIYDDFELPRGAQWGSHERVKGLLAEKPPIEELFKNIKVKNNKCNYDDAIFSFLNCWMGEELPESYVKKEKVIPKTGYEKKNIEKGKEKIYNINGGSSSSLGTSAMSTQTVSNSPYPYNINPKELAKNNVNFYLSDEDDEEFITDNQNISTPRQFSNKNLNKVNVLIDDTPDLTNKMLSSPLASSCTSLTSNDDERTINNINIKNINFVDQDVENPTMMEENRKDDINNAIINNNVYKNIKFGNGYSSATSTSDDLNSFKSNSNTSERTPLTQKYNNPSNTIMEQEEKLNSTNYSNNNKKFKLPFKDTITETFSKGKAILLPKNKNSSISKDLINEDQELPFSVVYNIWKVQHKYKTSKQNEQDYDEITIS